MSPLTSAAILIAASAWLVNAQHQPLTWVTCPELPQNGTMWQCANLTVPLDYQDSSDNRTLTLNLLRHLATGKPSSRGSVLFNPGGPGFSGRNGLVEAVADLLAYTGQEYDLVSWDPRGTGANEDFAATCFTSAADRQLFNSRTPDVTTEQSSITQAWGWSGLLSSVCKDALAGKGDLFGTAYVARDMMQIVDALQEDGMLRYYGASYGTALGQIFAAMFPDKVGRMVLDGVLNPHQYIHGTDYQQVATTDAVMDGFLSACVGQPTEICALAGRDVSVKNLQQQVLGLFDQIKAEPFVYGPSDSAYLDIVTFRSSVLGALYAPVFWTNLSIYLDGIMSNDISRVADMSQYITLAAAAPGVFPEVARLESVVAIRASDTSLRSSGVSSVLPIAENMLAQSSTFGGYIAATQPAIYARWPFVAKERYSGNFDVKTAHPILFLNNVYDPITSLDAARNASATFQDSRLLIQEGYGHSTLSQSSICTTEFAAAYFVNGTLPPVGQICNVAVPMFSPTTRFQDV